MPATYACSGFPADKEGNAGQKLGRSLAKAWSGVPSSIKPGAPDWFAWCGVDRVLLFHLPLSLMAENHLTRDEGKQNGVFLGCAT